MKFMVMTYESQADFEARTDKTRQETYWAGWSMYGKLMKEAGIISSMHGLQPDHTAKTVRQMDGRLQVREGAYANTNEQLGGYFIIEVPNVETAVEWAQRCPAAATGAVEVRPVM